MDQAWWFPAFAPLPGGDPTVMLAERSLPGCLLVDQNGERFINEATDYMSFGQRAAGARAGGQPGGGDVDDLRSEVPEQLSACR